MKKFTPIAIAAAIIAAPLFLATPAHAGGYDPEVTCEYAGFGTGRALTNSDHINMDIVQDGKKFQLNAYVDRNIQGGFDTLGVRVNTPSGQKSFPLTEAQVKAGALVFDYAKYLPSDSPWEVHWVQLNAQYFNQNRDPAKFLHCGEEEPPVIPEKPEPIIEVKRDEQLDCETRTVLIRETTTTTDWSLVNNVWVKDLPTSSYIDSTRPATEQECPLPEEPELPEVGFAGALPLGLLGATLLGGGVAATVVNMRRKP